MLGDEYFNNLSRVDRAIISNNVFKSFGVTRTSEVHNITHVITAGIASLTLGNNFLTDHFLIGWKETVEGRHSVRDFAQQNSFLPPPDGTLASRDPRSTIGDSNNGTTGGHPRSTTGDSNNTTGVAVGLTTGTATVTLVAMNDVAAHAAASEALTAGSVITTEFSFGVAVAETAGFAGALYLGYLLGKHLIEPATNAAVVALFGDSLGGLLYEHIVEVRESNETTPKDSSGGEAPSSGDGDGEELPDGDGDGDGDGEELPDGDGDGVVTDMAPPGEPGGEIPDWVVQELIKLQTLALQGLLFVRDDDPLININPNGNGLDSDGEGNRPSIINFGNEGEPNRSGGTLEPRDPGTIDPVPN